MPDTMVVIRAGIPGMTDAQVDGEYRYPASSSDFLKLLREQGLTVEYEHVKSDRTYVEFKSFDVWVPILDFSLNVAANIPANIIATTITNYVKRVLRRDIGNSVMHVKVSIKKMDGTVTKLEMSGDGPDVVKALKDFEQNARRD